MAAGILSALSYGSTDFVAGTAARRTNATAVAAIVQSVGAVLALIAIIALSPDFPPLQDVALAVLAGLTTAVAASVLYRALAAGPIATVASISGVGAVAIPVLVSLGIGASTSSVQLLGIACAISAVAVMQSERFATQGRGLRLGLYAAVALGATTVLLGFAAENGPLWVLATSRIVAALILWCYCLGTSSGRGRLLTPPIAVAGFLDGTATLMLLLAMANAGMAAGAALSGLYPVVTVVLASLFGREAISTRGALGVVLALLGVIGIAVG